LNRANERDEHTPGEMLVPGLSAAIAAHGDLAPLRFFAEFGRAYAARDVDRLVALFAEEWTMVDFRPHESQDLYGVDGARALIKSVFTVSPDIRFAIDDVLACDDRVIALTVSYNGRGQGGLGEFAYISGYVAVIEEGLWVSTSEFEHDDEETMLARYRALSAQRTQPLN
jgi:predicted ester cyclase